MKIEDYNEYYIQGSDHYLIPKDVFKELFNEMINWKEENKILRENAEHINITSISYSANGKRKTGGGYIWHFV